MILSLKKDLVVKLANKGSKDKSNYTFVLEVKVEKAPSIMISSEGYKSEVEVHKAAEKFLKRNGLKAKIERKIGK